MKIITILFWVLFVSPSSVFGAIEANRFCTEFSSAEVGSDATIHSVSNDCNYLARTRGKREVGSYGPDTLYYQLTVKKFGKTMECGNKTFIYVEGDLHHNGDTPYSARGMVDYRDVSFPEMEKPSVHNVCKDALGIRVSQHALIHPVSAECNQLLRGNRGKEVSSSGPDSLLYQLTVEKFGDIVQCGEAKTTFIYVKGELDNLRGDTATIEGMVDYSDVVYFGFAH